MKKRCDVLARFWLVSLSQQLPGHISGILHFLSYLLGNPDFECTRTSLNILNIQLYPSFSQSNFTQLIRSIKSGLVFFKSAISSVRLLVLWSLIEKTFWKLSCALRIKLKNKKLINCFCWLNFKFYLDIASKKFRSLWDHSQQYKNFTKHWNSYYLTVN